MRSTRIQLGAMMFLQYAIWGAWAPVLSSYLLGLGFSGTQIGFLYGLLPLATIVAPFIGGQLADRYFSSERLIAVLQLGGGVLLLYASTLTDYGALAGVMMVYFLLYAPTLALTNSVAMINLEDSERDFGKVRVWGTLGWITAGLLLTVWRTGFGGAGDMAMAGDMLVLGGVFSLIMGVQSLALPHTPPRKEAGKPWAFLEAMRMLRDRNFAVFMLIAFVVATELQFYYVLTAPFLESAIGIGSANVPAVMTIAQIAEIGVMAFMLSWFLKKYGMRATLALGVVAWPIRYVIFAIGTPWWLVVASLTLHGFCYVFFFVAAFIYVDGVAPPDIRASAQSLIAIATLGVGSWVGTNFAGWVLESFTTGGVTDWRSVFLVPCVITVLCAVGYLTFFRDERAVKEAAA